MSWLSKNGIVGLIACVFAGAVGCSQDKHVFHSTVDLPTTVTLYDHLNNRAIWTKDVPVQHTLRLDLDRAGENELMSVSGRPATSFRWSIYGSDSLEAIEQERIELPGTPVVLKVSYRPSPEFPDAGKDKVPWIDPGPVVADRSPVTERVPDQTPPPAPRPAAAPTPVAEEAPATKEVEVAPLPAEPDDADDVDPVDAGDKVNADEPSVDPDYTEVQQRPAYTK